MRSQLLILNQERLPAYPDMSISKSSFSQFACPEIEPGTYNIRSDTACLCDNRNVNFWNNLRRAN